MPERLDLKLSVLREADKVLRPEAVLASNTSSISITTLAAATGRPDRFIGMHFMNPVPVMVLVEVIRALQTILNGTQEERTQAVKTPQAPPVRREISPKGPMLKLSLVTCPVSSPSGPASLTCRPAARSYPAS